jgi:hypothetical protein
MVEPAGPVTQTVSIKPAQIHLNESITLTATPGPGLDLSGVQSPQVGIIPSDGVALLQAIPQSNGDLRVDFNLTGNMLGKRTLVIIGPDQLVLASGFFAVVPGF